MFKNIDVLITVNANKLWPIKTKKLHYICKLTAMQPSNKALDSLGF